MIVTRFLPIGFRIRLLQRIIKYNQKAKSFYPFNNLKKYDCSLIYFFTSFAFIWPVKKCTETNDKVIPDVLKEADVLFENGQYEQCCKLLTTYQKNGDVEVQWRICRVLYNISKESNSDSKTKKDLITQAYNIISKELQRNYDNFYVQKWYALLLDAKSANESIKERINNLQVVKQHMDLAVTLNPKDATTLYMLGEWCYQLADMPWHQRKIAETLFSSPPTSTYEDALEYFLRAESAEPRFYSLNLLRIGNCYLKLNKVDQANYYLKLAASYPAKSNDDHQANKVAARLLIKHFKNMK